jgi:DNA polymerase-1
MTQAVQAELIPAPESIALVDLSYLFKKRWHTTTDGSHMGAAKATLGDLEHLKQGVEHVILCLDAPPYNHRLAIFPEYKANRPITEPEERAQRAWLKKEIVRLGFNVAFCEGYEADDVTATLAKRYSVWCNDVRIVGVDKDAAQCLNERVKQYIPPVGANDWVVRDVAGVIAKWGVAPALMPFYQALVGDSSDNIPGVSSVGPKRAAELVNKYQTIERLAEGMAAEAQAQGSKPNATLKALAEGWNSLVMSLKLTTLDTNVPIDADSLLVAREPLPEKEKANSMDEAPLVNEHPAMLTARKVYQAIAANDQASKEDLLEAQYDRERQQNGESDTTSNAPGDKAAEPARASTVVPRTQMVKTQVELSHTKYGLVTSDLQPMDLTSAYQMSSWLMKGGLYSQYKTEAQIFTVMVRAKEMGLGITTALANHHIVEGKPVASADLIRALAERDANFEYLMPTKMSSTSVTWVGKHKRQPQPVEYTYTIEDARAAGLCRGANYGKPGNWEKRPQDMLMKTAGSKLARILWPGATMGCYCPEEMGYTSEELDAREAA